VSSCRSRQATTPSPNRTSRWFLRAATPIGTRTARSSSSKEIDELDFIGTAAHHDREMEAVVPALQLHLGRCDIGQSQPVRLEDAAIADAV
jgi:hypothetical protein